MLLAWVTRSKGKKPKKPGLVKRLLGLLRPSPPRQGTPGPRRRSEEKRLVVLPGGRQE